MRENGNGHADLLRWRGPKGYAAALTALLMRLEARTRQRTIRARGRGRDRLLKREPKPV